MQHTGKWDLKPASSPRKFNAASSGASHGNFSTVRSRHTLMALIIAVATALPAYAAENLQLVEQQIKAGMLYNFLKYTEWPAGRMPTPGEQVVVCVLGSDPFGGHL